MQVQLGKHWYGEESAKVLTVLKQIVARERRGSPAVSLEVGTM